MSITVVSACYGRYDRIKEPVPQDNVQVDEWLLVTDEKDVVAPGWTVIYEPRPHVHPNVAAKIPKFSPHLYAPYAQNLLWVDASSLIRGSLASAVEGALARSTSGWTMYPHPNRDRISDEVVASRGLPKYDDLALEAQVQHYFGHGYPDGHSLWATGVIGRNYTHRSRDIEFGERWLYEVVRWSFQDQLSFPFLLWQYGFMPEKLGRDLWVNEHIWFDNHGR